MWVEFPVSPLSVHRMPRVYLLPTLLSTTTPIFPEHSRPVTVILFIFMYQYNHIFNKCYGYILNCRRRFVEDLVTERKTFENLTRLLSGISNPGPTANCYCNAHCNATCFFLGIADTVTLIQRNALPRPNMHIHWLTPSMWPRQPCPPPIIRQNNNV